MSSSKPIRIAILADIHFGGPSPVPGRRAEIADILLQRAVSRLNRLLRPDVTLVLGDLVDNCACADTPARLARLRTLLDELESPCLVIPGNHDGAGDDFHRVFARPRPVEEIGGARFVAFPDDPAESGHNARRRTAELARLRAAREGFQGPVIALQHVCLFPPRFQAAPFNYVNADEVVAAMDAAGVLLSVSGHYHCGAQNCRQGRTLFVNAPALCEAPFPLLLATIEGEETTTERHELAMPAALRLVDGHVHTQLAYCDNGMEAGKAIGLARDFGLRALAFTEHSGQLYFDAERYWNKSCLREGMAAARPEHRRLPAYLALKSAHEGDTVKFGLEADCDYRGRLLATPEDRARFDYVVGAIHGLRSLNAASPPGKEQQEEFLFLLAQMLRRRIDVLAHPFRVFRRAGHQPPEDLYRPVARMLRRHRVAAEINFHANEPPPAFIRECLGQGVKFSFGSDAHTPAEIGDFACHLNLLRLAGFDGDPAGILFSPC